MDLLGVVIVLALLATILVMIMGVYSMGHGKNLDKKLGSGLMFARVGIQAIVILLLALAVYLR